MSPEALRPTPLSASLFPATHADSLLPRTHPALLAGILHGSRTSQAGWVSAQAKAALWQKPGLPPTNNTSEEAAQSRTRPHALPKVSSDRTAPAATPSPQARAHHVVPPSPEPRLPAANLWAAPGGSPRWVSSPAWAAPTQP